ncbi:hypothetical protein PMZ80_010400 [Knufia obscura]|uniref:Chromosome segregation ATPase family protein n=1 Tax=Knufia obscura TaxID=1635080 RepID=A0ABR0R9U1_9EURO|nr:hypothetical protein PMZ80_010400 [Knufia obscura]
MATTPSYTRDGSRDRSESRMVKHSHSYSECNARSNVPMWDSSDPDRAPPPLPLNPTVGNSPITRPNVSSNIEKAAALIASRALESAPSAYTSNPPPSPEKGVVRPQHRRMQSVQIGGSPGRLSDAVERRSPEKAFRTSRLAEWEDRISSSRTPDQSPTRAGTETPTPLQKSKSASDENTPPSSGMLALQATRNRQENEPLSDISNGASRQSPPSFDLLSTQISTITSIATSLQREMASLTKRSKDNAGDLSRLQEATNVRDEDIRKTLRDLVAGLDQKFGNIDSRLLGAPDMSRSTPNLPLFLEEKEHATPSRKSFNLPRISSPVNFLASELSASPSVVSVDGAASIAMLEKVLREMATKDGQEKLMNTLEMAKSEAGATESAPSARYTMDPSMMQKLEEILLFMKDMKADSGSKALVRAPSVKTDRNMSQMDIYLDSENKGAKGGSFEVINEEIVKTLKSVKQSLSQHGGLTNEVKALVRELRGEVLGMGREIAKKLDQAPASSRELELSSSGPGQEEVIQVVEQGLIELKEHMHEIVKNNDMQLTRSQPDVDTTAVIAAVTQAMAQHQPHEAPRDVAAEHDQLLAAVKEAWEDCKPEIALEHFGLERDEILDTLKEGLQSYQPQNLEQQTAGATYDQVIEAVQRGLADFQPPQIEAPPAITKEEISAAVQECLENFEFPVAAPVPVEANTSDVTRDFLLEAIDDSMSRHVSAPREQSDFSKDEILNAVREGLEHYQPTATKELEFNREDLFDAIKACLEGDQNPLGGMGERVVEAMHEFLGSMKTEFQEYTAANGRDTEQVLDALKDGLEDLRGEIETYVDRAADVTGKDEIIDSVKAGFAAMQVDMEKGFSRTPQKSLDTPELLDAMEKEFEHLRDTIRKSMTQADPSADKNEILDAIRDISDERGSTVSSNGEDIARLVKEELEHMRTTLASTLIQGASGPDRDEILEAIREGMENSRSLPKADGNESIFSNTSELLDAFQDGVDNIRADMQKLVDKSNEPANESANGQEILDSLNAGIENIRSDIEQLKSKRDEDADAETVKGQEVMLHDENGIQAQIESLKVMITQLGIKVEAMDLPTPDVNFPSEMRVHPDDLGNLHAAMEHHVRKDDLEGVHAAIREMQDNISTLPREMPEITIPEIQVPEAVMPPNAACREDIDALETLLHNVKAKLDDMLMPDLEPVAKTSQINGLEELLREVRTTVEDAAVKAAEPTHKEDFTIMELTLKDISSSIEALQEKMTGPAEGGETEGKLTKTDLEVLESLCLDMKTKLDEQTIPSTDGLATKDDLAEVKDSITSFREQFEGDNDLTAQAFEARKIEHGGLATKIDDVKGLVAEIKAEVLSKLTGNEENLGELSRVLGMHHDNMETYATAASITELSELVTKAFDAHIEDKSTAKTATEERDATLFSKVDDNHGELRSKLEEKFDELMTKYDDAQVVNDAKLAAMEERDKESAENNATVKGVVEELKGLMDALGTTVGETCEKLSDDSKTVFDVVDQSNVKLTELTDANSQEHLLTREEIAKTLDATAKLEGYLQEPHPALLAAIKEVLEKVGKHYEHSQQQDEKFSKATEEIKTEMKEIPSAIPALLPALPAVEEPAAIIPEPPVVEKYDDTDVQAKLDELVAHSAMAKEALSTMDSHHSNTLERLSGLDKIDGIHEKVNATAEEISAMVATQTRLMAEHHESKAEEAREAAIALEKRTAQKERVEADIVALTEEKNVLIDSMAVLKAEHEELFSQTRRLTRDVARLETSLTIRQEEMRDMNNRAETLERRILEGVMIHARTAKLAKSAPKKKVSPAERDASMSLKRVPSSASNSTARASAVKAPSHLGNAVGMALKKRAPLAVAANTNAAGRQSVDRRILSTSHVQNGQPKGNNRAMVLAPSNASGLVNLKRSQSVKSNPSTYLSGRKPSWAGMDSTVTDKENQSALDDETFDESSDAGTERRTSLGTSYMYTDSSLSRDSRRSTSYASSMGGTLNGHGQESILEEDEGMDDQDDSVHDIEDMTYHEDGFQAVVLADPDLAQPEQDEDSPSGEEDFEDADTIGDLPAPSDIIQHESKYAAASDSGLGSEPPTPDQSMKGWQSTVST